jgi:hypothetical protein
VGEKHAGVFAREVGRFVKALETVRSNTWERAPGLRHKFLKKARPTAGVAVYGSRLSLFHGGT